MTWTIAVAVLWGLVTGGVGAGVTTLGPWYYNLRKPSWQPPDFLFGPVWTIILAASSAAAVLGWNGDVDRVSRLGLVVLFVLNGALNILWSVLFFTIRRPDWALIEVVGLWLSILAMILWLLHASLLASLLVVPYLLWVSFATVLNIAIIRLNRPFGRVRA